MTFYPHRSGGQPHPALLQDFCKKAQWRAKKQTFCKKAHWRAKKLRERGSNAGRPTRKGGGGSRLGRVSVDFVVKSRLDFIDYRADGCPTPEATPKPTPEARHKKTRFPCVGNRAARVAIRRGSYSSANSSRKYICKRSKRSVRSGASMVHRDANV